jgi:hypothetical protein
LEHSPALERIAAALERIAAATEAAAQPFTSAVVSNLIKMEADWLMFRPCIFPAGKHRCSIHAGTITPDAHALADYTNRSPRCDRAQVE